MACFFRWESFEGRFALFRNFCKKSDSKRNWDVEVFIFGNICSNAVIASLSLFLVSFAGGGVGKLETNRPMWLQTCVGGRWWRWWHSSVEFFMSSTSTRSLSLSSSSSLSSMKVDECSSSSMSLSLTLSSSRFTALPDRKLEAMLTWCNRWAIRYE